MKKKFSYTYVGRTLQVLLGLAICAFASYMSIKANVGLAPWDAFNVGVNKATGLSVGTVQILTGVVILGVDLLLRGKIGVGTLLNTVMIGTFIDLFLWLDPIPQFENFWWGILFMLASQFVLSFGIYLYIAPGLGAGPRDTLMIEIGRRAPKAPIGLVRGLIEAGALAVGWALGAKVGLGTVLAVFGISFIMQFTFGLLGFEIKKVEHESIIETAGRIFKLGKYAHEDIEIDPRGPKPESPEPPPATSGANEEK